MIESAIFASVFEREDDFCALEPAQRTQQASKLQKACMEAMAKDIEKGFCSTPAFAQYAHTIDPSATAALVSI